MSRNHSDPGQDLAAAFKEGTLRIALPYLIDKGVIPNDDYKGQSGYEKLNKFIFDAIKTDFASRPEEVAAQTQNIRIKSALADALGAQIATLEGKLQSGTLNQDDAKVKAGLTSFFQSLPNIERHVVLEQQRASEKVVIQDVGIAKDAYKSSAAAVPTMMLEAEIRAEKQKEVKNLPDTTMRKALLEVGEYSKKIGTIPAGAIPNEANKLTEKLIKLGVESGNLPEIYNKITLPKLSDKGKEVLTNVFAEKERPIAGKDAEAIKKIGEGTSELLGKSKEAVLSATKSAAGKISTDPNSVPSLPRGQGGAKSDERTK